MSIIPFGIIPIGINPASAIVVANPFKYRKVVSGEDFAGFRDQSGSPLTRFSVRNKGTKAMRAMPGIDARKLIPKK